MQSILLLSKKTQPLFAFKVDENDIDLFKKWARGLNYDNVDKKNLSLVFTMKSRGNIWIRTLIYRHKLHTYYDGRKIYYIWFIESFN